ncbi:MAG TPA: hypothetical protein VFG56_02425 [Candidatus Saccharimonadales bacterium]|nr:hypothetical protein [Candidatus Saccharimonadales bacterium]
MTSLYWQKQSSSKPLFTDIEWNRPEQRARAGKLAIIGGSKLGFAGVSEAYRSAREAGVGQIRVILPDTLKKTVPIDMLEVVFTATNKSGGFSRDSLDDIKASLSWADHGLLIGDAGRNSETAIIYEDLLSMTTPLTITRDAADLLRNSAASLVERDHTTLVLSFAQAQRLFKDVYYPKMLAFSMQLTNLVETLHKFTITYPVTLVTFHQDQLIVAHDGKVISQAFDEPMMIWRGITASTSSAYQIWSPNQPLEAIATSWLKLVK